MTGVEYTLFHWTDGTLTVTGWGAAFLVILFVYIAIAVSARLR